MPQFYSALHGTFPTDYLRRKYFIRGDVQLTDQQSFFMRYALDQRAHRLRGVRRHERGVLRLLRRVPSRHAGHGTYLGHQLANAERPARAVAGAPSHATGPPGTSKWDQPGEFPAERFDGFTPSTTSSFHWGSNAQSLNWTIGSRSRKTSRTSGSTPVQVRRRVLVHLAGGRDGQSRHVDLGADQFFDGRRRLPT